MAIPFLGNYELNDVGNIVPFENIPVDQLPEHANDLANQHPIAVEQLQAIKYLYELAVNENADLHNALDENIQEDARFAKGFEDVLEATTKENILLKMEIIQLKNQKVEITNAAEENVKPAQQRIKELERVNSLQQDEIIGLKDCRDYSIKFLDDEIERYRHLNISMDELLKIRAVLLMTPYEVGMEYCTRKENWKNCIIS